MKILVFTTLYDMEARPDLLQDTSAIHYLLKYLSQDNEIMVINTYINRKKYLYRYLNPHNLVQFFKDYSYVKDQIKVHLFETQVVTGTYFHEIEWKWMEKRSGKILEKEKFVPDLVISHFPSFSYAYIDRLGFQCPKIAVLHFTDLAHADHRKAFVEGLREKYDAVFCRSKGIYEHISKFQLPNLREDIIYSGTIVPAQCEVKSFKNKKEFTILYAGKLIKRKNVDWIIRCLVRKELSAFKLWVVGNGPEEGRLRALVKKYGVGTRVEFLGQVGREKVQEIMKDADIFCMPSVNETFGLVYLEAMACGCLTIGTRKEGIDGVIEDGRNGFLISTEEELFECIWSILTEKRKENLERISQNAIRTGQEFSERNMSLRYFQLMKNEWEKWKKKEIQKR